MCHTDRHTIFLQRYFYGPQIDKLPEKAQPIVFDCSVNHGARQAVRFIQRVINDAGFDPIDEDGWIGNLTLSSCQNTNERMGNYFTNAIIDERLSFYDRLVSRKPEMSKFLKGWKNRANSFRLEVV